MVIMWFLDGYIATTVCQNSKKVTTPLDKLINAIDAFLRMSEVPTLLSHNPKTPIHKQRN